LEERFIEFYGEKWHIERRHQSIRKSGRKHVYYPGCSEISA